MSSERTDDPAELSFGEAMEELEGVLRRIESDEIDIDELGRELGRAARLLESCRKKIRRAEVEVRQIVEEIEDDGQADGAEAGDAAAGPERSVALPAPPDDPDDDIPF